MNRIKTLKSIQLRSVILLIIIFIISCYIRKPNLLNGFSMSDATYHTLLTMQAYDETPSSIHHWLPIQSFDGDYNKFINNGPSMIQDNLGNNYYVSFSSLGFMVPYFFCKFLHLPLNIDSLYIFNCLLLCISAILMGKLINLIFNDSILTFVSIIIYMFLPEVLYTQGIVYWHHSLSQIFLLAQIILFIEIFYLKKTSISKKLLFLITCFLYSYLEWTGYISNLGMILGILFKDVKLNHNDTGEKRFSVGVQAISFAIGLICITLSSLGYFIWKFTSIASPSDLLSVMVQRADSRSNASILNLLLGYKDSYLPLCILFMVCFFSTLCIKSSRNYIIYFIQKNIVILFISAFPIIENFLMREHAITYTFDRLKVSIILIILYIMTLDSLKSVKSEIIYFISGISILIIMVFGIITYGHKK